MEINQKNLDWKVGVKNFSWNVGEKTGAVGDKILVWKIDVKNSVQKIMTRPLRN